MSPDPHGTITAGDCLTVARTLPDSSIDLVYADPPFWTGKTFHARNTGGSFSDGWNGSIGEYLEFLRLRLLEARRTLKDTGSLLLHLDWHAVHDAKVLCDRTFGRENLQNEIIWSYNSGGGSKRRYGRKHDTILWYTCGGEHCFNADAARVPYDAIIAKKRAHLFHEKGKVSGDVLQISRPPNHAKEWTGWPTQKPLALLGFLIAVHSRPGDLVADFFCGSGTTLVAAQRLGRRWFGCDLSHEAVEIARQRLASATESGSTTP